MEPKLPHRSKNPKRKPKAKRRTSWSLRLCAEPATRWAWCPICVSGDEWVERSSAWYRLELRVQAHAAWGAPLEELALATPPLLPQEQWAPALKILKSKELYTFKNGEIQVPQGPRLGLDLNEEALERYKV